MKSLFAAFMLLGPVAGLAETTESVKITGETADQIVKLGLDPKTAGQTGNSEFISGVVDVYCSRKIPLNGSADPHFTCVLKNK